MVLIMLKNSDAMMTSSVYLKDTLPKALFSLSFKDIVSGDFYWIYKDQEDNIFYCCYFCWSMEFRVHFMSMIRL